MPVGMEAGGPFDEKGIGVNEDGGYGGPQRPHRGPDGGRRFGGVISKAVGADPRWVIIRLDNFVIHGPCVDKRVVRILVDHDEGPSRDIVAPRAISIDVMADKAGAKA